MLPAVLDTDTLSEVMTARHAHVEQRARDYLATHGSFTFSIITRYEILRGLKVKRATRQIGAFEGRCRASRVLPLTDEIVVRAADIYAQLWHSGQLIGDADILIAATALVHGLVLVMNNLAHFTRVEGLESQSWVAP